MSGIQRNRQVYAEKLEQGRCKTGVNGVVFIGRVIIERKEAARPGSYGLQLYWREHRFSCESSTREQIIYALRQEIVHIQDSIAV